MMKIIMDKRSDNGNRFLCLECVHSTRISGTMTEENIYCSELPRDSQNITYKVTSCNSFIMKSLQTYNNAPVKQLTRDAFILDKRSILQGDRPNKNFNKFIHYLDAVNSGLIYEGE